MKSFREFNEAVFKLYKIVGKASLEESGEGAVLYFVKESVSSDGASSYVPDSMKVLSLCKLKTLEYRILRKLREKLKSCIADKKGTGMSKWMKRFTKESQELCEFCEAAKPLDFYNTIASTAFEFIDAASDSARQAANIGSQFIFFLDAIYKAVEESVAVTHDYLKKHFSSTGEKEIVSLSKARNTRVIFVTPPFYFPASFKTEMNKTVG